MKGGENLSVVEVGEVERLRARVAELEHRLAHAPTYRSLQNGGIDASGEPRIHLLLDQLPAIVWTTDTDLRFTSSAGAGLRRLNLEPGQIVGQSLYDFRNDERQILNVDAHLRALQGESVRYEDEFAGLAYHSRVEPLRDNLGRTIGCVGVAHDITDLRRAQTELHRLNTELEERVAQRTAELRTSEALFRSLAEQIPDCLFLASLEPETENQILFVNPANERLLGYSAAELVGQKGVDFTDPQTRAAACDRNERLRQGETQVFEAEVVSRDGRRIPIEINMRMVDYRGQRAVLGVSRDLTQRREAERRLRLVQSAVMQVTDAVTITEANLDEPGPRIIYVNPAFERMTGYTAAEVIGKSPRILQGPNTSRAVLDRLRDALRRGRPFHGETYNYRKDGSEFIIEWRIAPIREDDGRITHWVAIQRDMTQQRCAEELAEQHRNELAHVSRLFTMGEMASGLAHELNQPLAAISNYAQGCLRRMSLGKITPDELREAMDRIAAQSQRAGQIIQRLRRFVRKREPRRSTTDLNEVVSDAVMLMEADTREHRATVEFDPDPSLPPVLSDSIQVEQVILNLLRNAIEAAANNPPDGRTVRVSTSHDADAVTLSVRDSGPGVPDADLHRIFDPFHTTKTKGMGMGLTISRTIVEAHGGRLTVRRNPDRGMTFSFTLPLPHRRPGHSNHVS